VDDPDKILARAKKLPSDDARRELRDRLRYKSKEGHDIDPDEREEYSRLADRIDALITTPATPVSQPPIEDADPGEIGYDYLTEHLGDWINTVLTSGMPEPRQRGIFNDVYRWLCDYDLLRRDKVAVEVIKKLDEWDYNRREKLLLAELIEKRLIGKITPIPRGTVADNIEAETRAIGNRGHDDGAFDMDDGGARPHITRRRTASDRKRIGGKAYDLDGTRHSQKRRAELWGERHPVTGELKMLPKVRELTAKERIERRQRARRIAKRLQQQGMLPKPWPAIKLPPPSAEKYRDYRPEDWKTMAKGDDALPDKYASRSPAVTEEQILRRASRAAERDTKLAWTTEEIKRQAEKAREAAEEAAMNEPAKLHGPSAESAYNRKGKLIDVDDDDDDNC